MTHTPVLLDAVLSLLDPKEGETVIDATIGLGGHAKAFLERIGRKGALIGMDVDEENLRRANVEIRKYENAKMVHANFRDLRELELGTFDIVFADLGLSSPHIDDPSRGFSFRSDGPLDCRYDRSRGVTAAEFIRRSSERALSAVFREYGELQKAHALARTAKRAPVRTTSDLARIAGEVFGFQSKALLPQIFQALRIAVNDELVALETLLRDGTALLKPGGRMGVISYHSLEDRLVKRRFRALTASSVASFELLTKKAITPTLEEIENNPRARSARFRVVRKVSQYC